MDREILVAGGIDYDEAMNRFAGITKSYEKFLVKFLKDDLHEKLTIAICKKEYDEAFGYSHTLKGVAGNLCLKDLYKEIVPLVEELRAKRYDDVDKMIVNVTNEYNRACAAIKTQI
ncbi:MAG: Hpt domain-containing protein [Oscillospiraceae bacterium]